MKTTGEAAIAMGIKPDKLSRILAKYPSYKPSASFGGRAVWTDADIDKADKIVNYVLHGRCPECGFCPTGDAADAEPTDDAE